MMRRLDARCHTASVQAKSLRVAGQRAVGRGQAAGRGAGKLRASRNAFTLLELTLSLGIVGLLMASLSSVVLLASRALPTSSGAASGRMAAASAAEQLGQDLRYATRILESEPHRLAFTIRDRNGSGTDETVVYEWAGPGEPLLRTFNDNTPVPLVESLHDFDLGYKRRRYATSEFIHTTVESGEEVLCGFNGWAGVSHTFALYQVTGLSQTSQRFIVDRITFPSDTVSWRITRVSMRLRAESNLLPAGVTIGIHRPAQLLGLIPTLSRVGTAAVVPSSAMTTTVQWHDATFNDVVFTNTDELDLCIVVKPAIATNMARVSYYTAQNPPKDEYVFLMSSDGGLSWNPSNNTYRNDAPFFVYGTYTRSGLQEVVTEVFTLGQVTVTLQPEESPASRLTSGVHLANHPEIPAP